MNKELESLTEYFRQNAVKFTTDPADDKIVEDPRDTSKIFGINSGMRAGLSEEKVQEAVRKIQVILDSNNIKAIACTLEGGGANGISRCVQIMSEEVMPKSLGIRSEFDGVPVGFSLVNDISIYKSKPVAPKVKNVL